MGNSNQGEVGNRPQVGMVEVCWSRGRAVRNRSWVAWDPPRPMVFGSETERHTAEWLWWHVVAQSPIPSVTLVVWW